RYPDVRLQVVGDCGGLAQELQERARGAGAAANVEFTGFVERAGLPALYQGADVFCSPAQYEGGVANVYLEAMACGCAVGARTAGGAPEAVADGQTGLLVPPGDVASVVSALDRILGDARLRSRLGEAARQRVESYFAMDQYVARVLAVYQKAIDYSL